MKKLAALLFFILLSIEAFATTATFQQNVSGYTGAKDGIIQAASTNEYSTTVPQMRTLSTIPYILYFDVSSISSTATVSSATIELQVSDQFCVDQTMSVRAIENPDNTGAFDAPATQIEGFNDYATWAYKDHGSTIKWDAAGGGSNFTDVDDNSAESTASSGACPGFVSKSWTVTNMVQGWVTTPNSNAGMVFSSSDGRIDVKGIFDGTSSNRPLLTVNYTDTPAGPVQMLSVGSDLKIGSDFKIQ